VWVVVGIKGQRELERRDMHLAVQTLYCAAKVATRKKEQVERKASEENSLPRSNFDEVISFLVPFRQKSLHEGFLGGFGGIFCKKMTKSFRNMFLKFIYNIKKKERGWRRNLSDF
jgi:hypothetical protein